MKQAKEVVEVEGLNQVINGNMTSIMPMRTIIGPNLENIGVEYGERRARIGAGTDRDRGRARGHDLEGAGEGQAHEEAEIGQEMNPEASQDLDQERDERRGGDEASFPGQDQDHPQHQKALDPGQGITTLNQDQFQGERAGQFQRNLPRRMSSKVRTKKIVKTMRRRE